MSSHNQLRRLAPPLIVLLLAWLLRCWHLSYYDFRGDEVFGIDYVQAPLSQVIGTLARGEPHPPLFYLLLHLWMPIAGNGPYALRWLSTAGDALAVTLLYILARRLAGPVVGAIAALLLAFAPYHVWNAQDARMYTLATAFGTAAAYWAWRLLLDRRPGRAAALGYVLAMLLALYTHYYSIYVAVLLNVFAVVVLAKGALAGVGVGTGPLSAFGISPPIAKRLGESQGLPAGTSSRTGPHGKAPGWVPSSRPRSSPPDASLLGPSATSSTWARSGERDLRPEGRARLWAIAQAIVALCYLPWVVFAWQTLTTYHGNAGSPSLSNAAREAVRTFALGWDLQQRFATPLLPVYVAVLILGCVALARLRRGRLALLLLLLWLLLPIGAIWYGSRTRPIFDVRYLIEASPPFYLLLALPAGWWRHRSRLTALAGAGAVAAIAIPLLPALWSLYFHPTDGRGHAYTALGDYLAGHTTASDIIIINHLDPVVRYYARRSDVAAPMAVEPAQQHESPTELNADLSRLTAGKGHVWLIPDDIGAWDHQHTVLAWCNRHLQPLGQVANGFHVIAFAPWVPNLTRHITFGDALTLTGAELPPTAPRPGQPWPVVLFWTAGAPTPAGETVSVQLLNAAGQLAAQLDAVPQNGQAPTTGWLPGETIPDPHTVPLPTNLPPGQYTLAVAVYPSAVGSRLAVEGRADGLAVIDTVTVEQ